jgi:hypothetical protein
MIGSSFTRAKVQTLLSQLSSSREALEGAGNFPNIGFGFHLLTDRRGGFVEEKCAELVNAEAARVVYKNNYSFGVKLFNIYMVS